MGAERGTLSLFADERLVHRTEDVFGGCTYERLEIEANPYGVLACVTYFDAVPDEQVQGARVECTAPVSYIPQF